LLLGILTAAFHYRVRHQMADFEVNYRAGQRLRSAETLYRIEDEHYMFKYLPASAILYAPLTLVSLPAAKAIWYGLILICSALLVYLAHRLLPHGERKSSWTWLLPALILGKYFFREWDLGQINTMVGVVLLGMTACLAGERPASRTGREIGAGLFWGMGVALKPYALIFLPYLVLKGRWRGLAAGMLAIGAALAIPVFYYGLPGNLAVHREWFTTLSRSTPGLLDSQDNISLLALFVKWTGDRRLAILLAGCAVAALALLVLWMVRRGRALSGTTYLDGSVLLLCIPLVSPLGWDYTLILAFPALMVVIQHFRSFSRPWQGILIVDSLLIALTLYDVMGEEYYAWYLNRSIPTLNFLLILGYALYLRGRRLC
jgi:hypothetical protein